MRNQKLLLGLLIVLFSGLCLVMLVFNGAIYSLVGLATLIPALILPPPPSACSSWPCAGTARGSCCQSFQS